MSENRRRRPVNPSVPDSEPVSQEYAQAPYRQPQYQQPRYEQPRPQHQQPRYEQPRPQPQQPRYEQPRPQPQQNMVVNQISINNESGLGGSSYFDGGLLQLIGWTLLGLIITSLTLGFGYPFAACMLYRWEADHTVINGRRLRFDGTGMQLLGKWIVWILLTIITLGIYGFWLVIKLKQWRIKHTHFA